MIGIAKTGSGKTFAFLGPLLVHIMDQRRLLKGDGPIGLILVPTRELAMQIYSEAKKFGRVYDIQAVCAYGGGSKWEQSKAFEAGAEIAIATPGRLIDMIKMKVTNLERVGSGRKALRLPERRRSREGIESGLGRGCGPAARRGEMRRAESG